MSDRVLVMREGRRMGIFTREEATQEDVMTRRWANHAKLCASSSGECTMKAIIRARVPAGTAREFVIILVIVVLILFFGTQINDYLTGRTSPASPPASRSSRSWR